MAKKLPRGIANCNPGNIDRNSIKWQGMAADQSQDSRFVVFTSPEYGIRALGKLLLTYQSKYRLRTVRGIINRWAPPGENDTGAYVEAVAKAVGVDPNATIDLDTMAVMLPMVKAIIAHENGKQPYADAVLVAGLRMAGVADAPLEVPPALPPKPLVKQTSFVTKVAAGALATGATCSQYVPQVKGFADSLAPYAGVPVFERLVTVLMTAAGTLLVVSTVSSYLKQRAEAKRVGV